MVRAWGDLQASIAWCRVPGRGFDQLITRPQYRERWEALLREGYVVANWWGQNTTAVEPLAPERYAMRTRYVLATIAAPGHHFEEVTHIPLP
jgi:hypothetical protein